LGTTTPKRDCLVCGTGFSKPQRQRQSELGGRREWAVCEPVDGCQSGAWSRRHRECSTVAGQIGRRRGLARLDCQDGRAWKVVVYGVPVGLLSGTLGILEGATWAIGGVADTATAGYFEIGRDDATRLSLMPVLPLFVPDARHPRWAWGLEDRCGRRRVAPEPPPPTPGPLPPDKLRP
jgi:hypothetical protein